MRTPLLSPSSDLRSQRVTLHNVTAGQKAPLGQILRNFWLRKCTPKGTPLRGHVTSGRPVGHAQWYYCTTTIVRRKERETVAHTHAITSGQGLFRLRHFRWKGPTKWVMWSFRMRIPYFQFRTWSLLVTRLPVTWVLVASLPVKHAQWSNPLRSPQMWFVRTHILLMCTYNCPLSIGTLMKEGVN